MNYVVRGTVPTPRYDPEQPYYDYERNDALNPRYLGRKRPCGKAGRKISVTTENASVATTLESVMRNVLDNVELVVRER